MYCPRCGQQALEEVRFCSRCGLPLEDSAVLVESGGLLDAAAEGRRALTPRQRGVRKGLMITVGGVLFFVLAFFLMTVKEDLFVFMPVAAVVFTFGIMRVLYGLLLEDDAERRKTPKLKAADERESTRAELGRVNAAPQLPHARTRPASDFAKKSADTTDMAPPPTVAEATTKLLKEDA